MEDKKCRICGYADIDNSGILNLTKRLIEKVAAVFPIIIYQNDPLPKHICRKCLYNTTTMYVEIEKAMRNQNKWIANVRAIQPNNNYVKVVDNIVEANKQTAILASKLARREIGKRTICRLFNMKFDDTPDDITTDTASVTTKLKSRSERMDVDLNPTPTSNAPKETIIKKEEPVLSSSPTSKITELKSVLALNGCTLTKVKTAVKSPSEVAELINIPTPEAEIKEEPPFDEPSTEYSIECKMCSFHCETVEELAIHQLNHLSLSLPKLGEKKYLDKRTRRGRLIRVDERKCIRCLNCWRIFVDNKAILHHWSAGDCDFFCQICGKEFASSPKMLREHIPAAHGISFKSAKLLRLPTGLPKKPIKKETPQKAENPPVKGVKGSVSNEALSVKVACSICLKVFANFKARNSHMRAHKNAPLLPAQPPPSLSDTLLTFNRTKCRLKEEMQDYDDIPFHIVRSLDAPTPSINRVVMSNSASTQQLHLPSNIIPHSLPSNPEESTTSSPAGVRTKYVQSRSNPTSVTFKCEPGNGPQVLKVKSLVDLQDPSVTSQQPEDLDKSGLLVVPTTNNAPTSNGMSVQAEPKDNMNYGQIFNCHPCGGKFSSKLELFRHKRKCTANNLFPCQFCSRHFLTSADLQMHIMLLHKNSSAQ